MNDILFAILLCASPSVSSSAIFTLTACKKLACKYFFGWLSFYSVIWNIFKILTTCHTQTTWDSRVCVFLFNRTILQVFVTYLTGALYVHPSWFYKHQHDNRVCSKLCVACQRWWFQWRFWFVPSVPGYVRYVTKTWCVVLLNKKYIYCYLKCIVYDKLLNPRESFQITQYFTHIYSSLLCFAY